MKNVLSKLQLFVFIFALSACANLTSERLVYDQQGTRVGIQWILPCIGHRLLHSIVIQRSLVLTRYASCLGTLHVSGWSGTIVGVFARPRPIPLFKEEELTCDFRPIGDGAAPGRFG